MKSDLDRAISWTRSIWYRTCLNPCSSSHPFSLLHYFRNILFKKTNWDIWNRIIIEGVKRLPLMRDLSSRNWERIILRLAGSCSCCWVDSPFSASRSLFTARNCSSPASFLRLEVPSLIVWLKETLISVERKKGFWFWKKERKNGWRDDLW